MRPDNNIAGSTLIRPAVSRGLGNLAVRSPRLAHAQSRECVRKETAHLSDDVKKRQRQATISDLGGPLTHPETQESVEGMGQF
jgi:hypothetical protein